MPYVHIDICDNVRMYYVKTQVLRTYVYMHVQPNISLRSRGQDHSI